MDAELQRQRCVHIVERRAHVRAGSRDDQFIHETSGYTDTACRANRASVTGRATQTRTNAHTRSHAGAGPQTVAHSSAGAAPAAYAFS
jgi:hypothetical protein